MIKDNCRKMCTMFFGVGFLESFFLKEKVNGGSRYFIYSKFGRGRIFIENFE